MTEAKKQKYIVLKGDVCINVKTTKAEVVGSTISLTDAKALSLVGKVKLASEHQVEAADTKKLANANTKLESKLEELAEENKELKAKAKELEDALNSLGLPDGKAGK